MQRVRLSEIGFLVLSWTLGSRSGFWFSVFFLFSVGHSIFGRFFLVARLDTPFSVIFFLVARKASALRETWREAQPLRWRGSKRGTEVVHLMAYFTLTLRGSIDIAAPNSISAAPNCSSSLCSKQNHRFQTQTDAPNCSSSCCSKQNCRFTTQHQFKHRQTAAATVAAPNIIACLKCIAASNTTGSSIDQTLLARIGWSINHLALDFFGRCWNVQHFTFSITRRH